MKGVVDHGDAEIKDNVAAIKAKMECERGFECLRNGFENLCRANNFSGGKFPECKEKMDCQYKAEFGFLYLCQCPLRIYMFDRIKIERPERLTHLPT